MKFKILRSSERTKVSKRRLKPAATRIASLSIAMTNHCNIIKETFYQKESIFGSGKLWKGDKRC